jgi:uncharacterized protein (DUF1499 family)
MTIVKWAVPAALLLILLYLAALSWIHRNHSIKAIDQRAIEPCRNKPNCISSNDSRNDFRVEPWPLLADGADPSWQRLVDTTLRAGGQILVNERGYLHAVFTSRIFRYRDDFEAQLMPDSIAVRSASRAGTSDLGVNRKRISALRADYLSAQAE